MSNLTTSYFSIEKADRNPDGTMTVYGKATDSSIDIDQQICDSDWLDRAMPHWFKSGGNIREQHSNIAAGVATDYEAKSDGHYISALVVDPVSVKKVDAGVLKGFSVGIKNPRVVRDTKAANGRIVDGQIVEISLVDRPANPNCTLVLAKSVNGEETVVQVEELHENNANENLIESDNNSEKESDTMATTETVEIPKSIVGDLVKFDKAQYEAARDALANLISIEGQEIKEGHNELMSISHLLEAVAHLHAWYEGEEAEGEVVEEAELEMAAKKESDEDDDAKPSDEEADDEAANDDEAPKKKAKKSKKKEAEEKAADSEDDEEKCAECGKSMKMCKCNTKSDAATDMTPTAETGATLDTATMVSPTDTPKSAEATEEAETKEDSVEPNSTEKLDHLVEEVVEQVTKSLKSEIASLIAAKEAAEADAMALRSELATAKTLAMGGGPKRTAKPIDAEASEELLLKASIYEAKAKATTDKDLVKGYKQLAKEFLAKHAEVTGK